MSVTDRPVPVPDASSAGYWEATARHELAIARCSACHGFTHPPDTVCIRCGSIEPRFTFEPVSGRGIVKSWTVVRQALLPGFEQDVPFLLVDVELSEQAGLRITGRLLDGVDTALKLGDKVQVDFEDIADGVACPAFRLATS
ncbi:MAG: OB-fold domain-containing protein [Sphingomonadaceae bacterium]|nr:OB-fold domain-containing protein [Sphingomonadaceae bacterium]